MSEATTPAVVENTAAPAKAAKKAVKKTAAKTATGKKTAKKTVAAKKTPAKKSGPSIRERVFKLLNRQSNGLSGAAIQKALELSGIPALLKDEGVCEKPRIRREKHEGARGVVYLLTAAGKKAVENGTVDSGAAPKAAGNDWPEGR